MSEPHTPELHLVRVGITDLIIAGAPAAALWVAATPRDFAVETVARAVPPDWTVELVEHPIPSEFRVRINISPGTVSELSSALS